MNSCLRQEKINIEFLKELVRSGKYDKKQFEDKLRQEGETWASAMRYYIQHAHEPKVYTKGRNRSDVYGRDYCNTSIQRMMHMIDLKCNGTRPLVVIITTFFVSAHN